jgi:GT2 family glycosyltransferase
MFWARPAALAPLAKLAGLAPSTASDYPHQYAKDGQQEHALERLFGLIPHCFESGDGQIGLLHAPTSRTEPPAIQIIEVKTPTARLHIQPGHATQAVRDTLARIDWPAKQSKQRHPKLVSIIIPVYNQPELTAVCVASLYQHTDTKNFELILVDNGSAPPTQALLQELTHQHPNVRLLRNPENRNFATGCNQGFAASQGDIVVFLNNDTSLTPHWLTPLVEALSRPGVATVQPKLIYPDGGIQCIGVVFSDKSPMGYPIYAGMKPELPWANRSRAFQAVTGACMAMRAGNFASLQGFDPIYINGQEDIDLCLRLNQSHGKFCGWVATESTVIHHESKTTGRFSHVESNRRTFIQRWQNKVRRDDLDYFAADGFSVIAYQPDSPKTLPAALQIYRPELTPKIDNRCPDRTDFHFSAIVSTP